jgi:hypothetical protein
MHHCCELMQRAIEHDCPDHPNSFDCADCLIHYSPKFREYGLIVHDGGSSTIEIRFCPWCGQALPASLRDEWFAELRKLGIEPENAPEEFRTGAWHQGRAI